jgi:hypothetical protein
MIQGADRQFLVLLQLTLILTPPLLLDVSEDGRADAPEGAT